MDTIPDDSIVCFGMSADEITRIFRLRDSNYYILDEHVAAKDVVLDMMTSVLKGMNTVYADDLTPEQCLRAKIGYNQRDDGCFICHITYPTASKSEMQKSERSALIIGKYTKSDPNGEYNAIRPYFVMTGFQTYIEEQKADVFIPRQVICRTRKYGATQEAPFVADTPSSTLHALCYGREAMEIIFTNEDLDVDALQFWLNPNISEEAAQRYIAIKNQSPAAFTASLEWRVAERTAVIGGGFTAPTPPTFQ